MNWLLDIKERKEVKNMRWTTPEDDDGDEIVQGSSICPSDTDDDGEGNEEDDSDEGEGDGEDQVFPPAPEDEDPPPDPPPEKPDTECR